MPYGDPDRSVMDGLQHPQGQLPYPAVPAHNRFSLPAVPVPHPAVWDPLLPAYLPALAYGTGTGEALAQAGPTVSPSTAEERIMADSSARLSPAGSIRSPPQSSQSDGYACLGINASPSQFLIRPGMRQRAQPAKAPAYFPAIRREKVGDAPSVARAGIFRRMPESTKRKSRSTGGGKAVDLLKQMLVPRKVNVGSP